MPQMRRDPKKGVTTYVQRRNSAWGGNRPGTQESRRYTPHWSYSPNPLHLPWRGLEWGLGGGQQRLVQEKRDWKSPELLPVGGGRCQLPSPWPERLLTPSWACDENAKLALPDRGFSMRPLEAASKGF